MTARTSLDSRGDREPTLADLDAIDAEWPLIAAELAALDAEIAIAAGDISELAGRRLAVAHQNLAAVAAGFTPTGTASVYPIRRSA